MLLEILIGAWAAFSCFTSRKSLCVFGLDGLFGAAGSIAAASISASAAKKATEAQIKALERQRKFIFEELEPGKLTTAAEAQDVARARAQRALQASLSPELAGARVSAEESLARQLAGLEGGPGDVVAQQAATEALAATGGFDELKQRLIDSALTELDAGATLPQDVQAELVKAGLERGARATGAISPTGLNETRRLIGQEGLKLQAERQARAASLGQMAQDLETRRAAILGSLFPALKQNQLKNLAASEAAITLSQSSLPAAGLTGTDLTNLWLQRVGATGQLMGRAGEVAAAGGLAQANLLNQAIGGGFGALASAGIPSSFATALGNLYNTGTFSTAPRGSL